MNNLSEHDIQNAIRLNADMRKSLDVKERKIKMKKIKAVVAEKSKQYKKGYSDAQKDIISILSDILYSGDISRRRLIIKLNDTGYGLTLNFGVTDDLIGILNAVSIAYPECVLSNNNIGLLKHSLNKINKSLRKEDKK